MKRLPSRFVLAAGAMIWLAASSGAMRSHAQNAGDEVLVQGFEGGVTGWHSLDPEAKVRATTEKNSVHAGTTALEYEYRLREGGTSMLGWPGIAITGTTSLDFWAKCTHTTGLAFGLSKKNEARYGTMAYLPADTWTHVVVNIDELQLGEDSRDPDGKLDVENVNSLWMADIGIFTQMLNPEIRGGRKLWLDDVKFMRPRVPSAAGLRGPNGQTGYMVDSFEGGLLRWLPISVTFDPVKFIIFPKTNYDLTTDVPEGGGKAALKIGYPRPRLSAFALVRDTHGMDIGRTEKVSFWIRTDKTGQFFATMEKTNGARYQRPFNLTPNLWTRVEFPVSEFTLADDSKDADGALTMAKVKQFGILEINLNMLDAGDNTIYLDEVAFLFGK